ncbi:MAG: hypothetical protein IJE10_04220 [Clostridia bacterium]|nr:hypothetical protein [Clostridia bacterium]
MKRCISLLLTLCMLLSLVPAIPVSAEQPISVYVNGEKLEFDVDPVLINDRTMVPMRKIFETLGAVVSWNGDSETASGVRNGVRVSVTIDSPKARVGNETKTLDQPPVLLNGRTLVPLRFISESFGAKVEWVDETQTVNITMEGTANETYYFAAKAFEALGSWELSSDCLFGSTGSKDDETGTVPGTEPAVTRLNVNQEGTYKVWVLARDFATNRQGHRYFNVAIDGKMSDMKVGTHGKDGFHWQEAGLFILKPGSHTLELHDTSGYWARCQAVLVTADKDFVPSVDAIGEYAIKYSSAINQSIPVCVYPYWATQPMQESDVISIENDGYKVNFIKGQGAKGALIQNEIFVKKNGEWLKVKDKSEQFGFLMMAADHSETATPRVKGQVITSNLEGEFFKQTLEINGKQETITASNFYESGVPYWFLANNMQKISDTEVKLFFPTKAGATVTAICSLDALCNEPKFQLNAKFDKDGAYSFLFFSGDAIDESKFERVLAPFMFTREYVPTTGVFSEVYMFTPMVSFVTNTADGGTMTEGVVVDPTSTVQDVAYVENARYGFVLRDEQGGMRPALCAPMFGTPASNFKAGDTYSFAYRVFAGTDGWYETFKHVSQDIYEVKDIRTNYHATLNEAIFNITDLMADDLYGAWDEKTKGFYYAEMDHTASQCNPLEIVQRYLLSEDEEFYEERVVPTIAFLLSRQNNHFNRYLDDESYMGTKKLGLSPNISGSAMYTALYKMSQGRMPYLLDAALTKNTKDGLAGVAAQESFYEITGDAQYKENVKKAADAIISSYETEAFKRGDDLLLNAGFVSGDFNTELSALIYTYELTGEQKYLDAAEEVGRNAALTLSSLGYQNGYDDNMYHVDPQTAADAHVIYADNTDAWWWRGDVQWRIGFPHGTWGPLEGTVSTIDEDDAPGWTFATAGLTTEHARTAGHSNFILMNTWAPSFLKLAQYTGDEYFTTQARNAIVGRFSNYPGYYIDRYYTDYMKERYPYEGPEYNMFYYTHVAPFAALAEDFLITEFKTRSNGKVSFPEVHFDGYSYFTATQYGARPGQMYGEQDLWLWNTDGIMETSDVNVNFLAGRKDGVMGLALMNQSQNEVTTEITLGAKVPKFTGEATLYALDGSQSAVQVTDGKFTVTIPAKGMQTAILKIPGMKKPAYALDEIKYTTNYGKTVTTHKNGRGYLIQLNPEKYHAYVFITDQDIKSLRVDYEVNGKNESVVCDSYPFEAIIPVNSPDAELTYNLYATLANGTESYYGSGKLAPMSNGPATNDISKFTPGVSNITDNRLDLSGMEMSPEIPKSFKGSKPIVSYIGVGVGTLRVVCLPIAFGYDVKENTATGLYVRGTLKLIDGSGGFNFEARVLSNEARSDVLVLNVAETPDMHLEYKTENMELVNFEVSRTPFTDKLPEIDNSNVPTIEELAMKNLPKNFKEQPLNVDYAGVGVGTIRIVAFTDNMDYEVKSDMFFGTRVKGNFVHNTTKAVTPFEGKVLGNEVRSNSTIIVVEASVPGNEPIENFTLTDCVLFKPEK